MTVIRPNSVSGINSITVQSGNSLAVHKANGELIRTLTSSSGVSTFSTLSVGTATTDNSAATIITIIIAKPKVKEFLFISIIYTFARFNLLLIFAPTT